MKKTLFLLLFAFFAISSFGQEIRGRVIDATTGDPIPGVAIMVSTGGGTSTTIDGTYVLSAPANASLTFSCLGYVDAVEQVAGRSRIDVKLSEEKNFLEELVVMGYTMQKKSELTSAVVSLSEERLTDVTTPDVGNMLQGKVAGVVAMNASGQPGDAAEIRIRGTGSITAGSGPLYVVDGVAGGSFNPNDIETLTVLKDASATALYGASAAGGVIVITTKSAKSDQTQINFKATAGIKRALMGRFDTMNSEELYYAQSQLYSKNLFKSIRPATLLDQDFDWIDACFSTGVVQDYYASVSGKVGRTSYFASVDHYGENGSLINTGYKRNSARLNLSTALSDNLTLNIKLAYNNANKQEESSYLTLEHAYQNLPWDNPYDAVSGEPIYIDSAVRSDGGTWYSHDKSNVFHSEQYNYGTSTGEGYTADIQLNWNITPWMTLSSTTRFDSSNSTYNTYIDPRTKSPSYSNGYLYRSNSHGEGFGTTNLLKVHKAFGQHVVDGVVGWEYGTGYSVEAWASGTDMPSGQDALSNCKMREIGGYDYPSLSWATLAQLQYSYAGKYIATASIRYDETSRFAPKARGGFFPGVSAAWVISKENFMKNVGFVNLLKLRAGYGKTGNNNIEEFLWQDQYSLSVKYENEVGAILTRQSNPNLGWEEAYMTSVGIDAELIHGINVTLDLYNTTNTNLLLSVPQAISTGFFEFMDNVGTINNKGIEFAVSGNLIESKDFKLNAGVNIGINRNSVVELPNGSFLNTTTQNVSQLVDVGKDLYTWYMPKWVGVDPENGDPLWEGKDEEGNIIETNDYSKASAFYQEMGTASPKFSGGFNLGANYKGLFLNANFYAVYGNKIYNYTRQVMDSDGAYTDYNMMSIDNGLGWSRWEQPGDIATHPKLVLSGNKNANAYSSRYLEDGSFLRLKNVTLGYNLPKSLLSKLNIGAAKVYVSADNIFTLSRFSGTDPEVRLENSTYYLAGAFSHNYPVPFTLAAGIDITF